MADATIDVLGGPDAIIKMSLPPVGTDLAANTPLVDTTAYVKSFRMRAPFRLADVTTVGMAGTRRSRGSTDDAADMEFISEGDFMQRVKRAARTRTQEVLFEIGPDGETVGSGTEKIEFQGFFSDYPHEISGGEGEQRFSVPVEIQGQPTYSTY